MNNEYIQLVQCVDNGAPLLNMRVMQSSPMVSAVDAPVPPCECKEERSSYRLSDFNVTIDPDYGLLKRTAQWMLGEIRKLDEENAVKYSVYYDEYSDRECSVSVVSSEPPTTELIQRFSFNISTYVDQNRGPIAKIYVGGLYVNRKYHDVGSNLLSIAKSAIRYMVNIGGFNVGMIELYSVETAVLFYIKNEFVIKDLFWQVDPQSKVYATQRMIDFAMKESNINIMKKYATVTSENFLDFVKFLLEKTKYGKYFTAYFEALNNPDEIEKSVMQSRFISSIFNTNMVWLHIRDTSKPRVNLKPLTL